MYCNMCSRNALSRGLLVAEESLIPDRYIDMYVILEYRRSLGRLCVLSPAEPWSSLCIIFRKQKACSCTSSTTGAAYAARGACVPNGALRTHSAEQAPLWGCLVTCVVYRLHVRQC